MGAFLRYFVPGCGKNLKTSKNGKNSGGRVENDGNTHKSGGGEEGTKRRKRAKMLKRVVVGGGEREKVKKVKKS